MRRDGRRFYVFSGIYMNAIKTCTNTFKSAIVGARCVEIIERVIEQQRG